MCHYEPIVQGKTVNNNIVIYSIWFFCYHNLQPLSIALACIVVYVRAGGSLGSLGKCLNWIESGWKFVVMKIDLSYVLIGSIGRSQDSYTSVDGENTESQ